VSEQEDENYLVEPSDETRGADYRGILLDWDAESEGRVN
jgi:hypothetical protein